MTFYLKDIKFVLQLAHKTTEQRMNINSEKVYYI